MTNMVDLHRKQAAITAEINAAELAHKTLIGNLSAQRGEVIRQIKMVGAALDLEKIKLAETVLEVRGSYEKAGEDRAYVRQKAIEYLVKDGGASLWRRYVGTKSYAHWHGQSIECEYFLAPTHGFVIFKIEVVRTIRESRKPGDLTPDEIEACVYYLVSLELIQKAKAEAAAA